MELTDKEREELQEKQLEITTQYTQKPEEDALDNTGDGTGDNGNTTGENTSGENNTGEPGGDGQTGEPAWKSYPIDPATGYRVNPETGEKMDPDTGDPAEGNLESVGADVPANPAIQNPDTVQ